MMRRRMFRGNRPETVTVESGRLNATVREVLKGLSVATSDRESDLDVVLDLERSHDGTLLLAGLVDPRLDAVLFDPAFRLCSMVVAGTNVIGRASVRIRFEDGQPVFISMEVAS